MPRRGFVSSTSALLAFSLLALNPVVLFLLLGNPWTTAGLTVAGSTALLACYRRFGRSLPTVYLVNALGLIGLFSYGELLVRVKFADYVMEDLYEIRDGHYFNRPYLKSHINDKEFATDYLTNKDGFRIGYSQQVDVSFNQVDWLFLGDSYTQGAQVQFEELYTTQLYRRFPDRIIANAGISGWGIPEELSYLRANLKRLRPKVVVLQVSSFNDFMKVTDRKAGVSDHLMQHSLLIRWVLQDFKYQNPARLPLGRWAEPFYPDDDSNRRFNAFYRSTSPEKKRDLESYSNYLARVATLVRENGARLLVVLLPTKEQIHFPYLEEVVSSYHIDPRELDMQFPNRFMRRLADSLSIELLDAQAAFEAADEQPYFDYDEHLSRDGHRLLADFIGERLSTDGFRSESRVLSKEYGGDRYPSYAPSGKFLVFQSVADGNMEIFRTDSRFDRPTRITFNGVQESHPVVSSVGDRLAFTEGDAENGLTEVVLSDLAGQSRTVLTDSLNEFGAIPDFSPDSKQVAYARWTVDDRTKQVTTPQIVIRDLATGAKRVVSEGPSEHWRPVFSPNGRQLAFIAKTDGQFDVFLADLASGAIRPLTRTPYDEWDPRFSPDGGRIVYAAKATGNWDLYLVSLSTGLSSQLTHTRGDEWDPVFSLRGDSVTYAGEYGIFRGIYRMAAKN